MDVHYTACNISEDNAKAEKWFSPKRALFRYIGLLLICLLSFGKCNFKLLFIYFFDNKQILKRNHYFILHVYSSSE